MNPLGCLLACVLATTPQAKLTVIGPDVIQPGAVIAFDAGKSTSDFPLAWVCSPPDGALLRTFPEGTAWFIGGNPGTYTIVMAASGWTDPAKKDLQVAIASKTVTVSVPTPPTPPAPPNPPNPPNPPEPTDPLTKAAVQYRKDLMSVYSVNYGAAASQLMAHTPLKTVQPTLQAAMATSARSMFNKNFAPWASLFPPDGTEPTTTVQWNIVQDTMHALSEAFK